MMTRAPTVLARTSGQEHFNLALDVGSADWTTVQRFLVAAVAAKSEVFARHAHNRGSAVQADHA